MCLNLFDDQWRFRRHICVLSSNLALVSKLAGLDCTVESAATVRQALPIKTVPESESWRVGLLDTLLRSRAELEKQQSDTKRVTALISSLCTTWLSLVVNMSHASANTLMPSAVDTFYLGRLGEVAASASLTRGFNGPLWFCHYSIRSWRDAK